MIKHGVINLNKEAGFTSHDAVAVIKGLTKMKTGHTGTLDPDATGVLPICLGKGTRFSSFFTAEEKTYAAEVIPGIITDTWDMSGTVISKNDFKLDREKIEEIVDSFHIKNGIYNQMPPMYSAIKIKGKKLYELARKGVEVEREPRPVEIHEIYIKNFSEESFTIHVKCSKGTYIRSLCHDIGQALGFGAAMGKLERTSSGMFHINDSVTISKLREGSVFDYIKPINGLLVYPELIIKPSGLKYALNGNKLSKFYIDGEADGLCWLKNDGSILGLYRVTEDFFVPEVMML